MKFKVKILNVERILAFVFFICVFLLALIKIDDTDTWTHLNLGKIIFELRGFPANEPFVYPSLNKPFYNPEWLFDLIYYIAYASFALYGVIILKACTITAVFYILFRDSLVPEKNELMSIAVLTCITFMTRHRFVERPDTVLMLFLAFSIFALNAFVYGNKKYIYLLPFIQVIWVNMHFSVIMVAVPFFAFIGGGVVQKFLNEKYALNLPGTPTTAQVKTMGIIFILVLAFSLINPYLQEAFTAPFELMSADWWRDEIAELQPPTWDTFKSPYIMTAVLAVSFLTNIRRFSLINLSLVIPFVYLAFTGVRFIYLMGIVGAPIIVRNFSAELPSLNRKLDFYHLNPGRNIVGFVLALCIAISSVLAIAGVKPFALTDKVFGFGVNYDYFPEGAMQYLDKRKITGRIFNTFQWGGYITWRDFPGRSVFVDGRSYLSIYLLESLDQIRIKPDVMANMKSIYNFNVAVLNYPQWKHESVGEVFSDRDLSLSSKDWALVYWDDLSLVYLNRDVFKDIIQQDEYRYVKPANGPAAVRSKLHDKEFYSGLISELRRNTSETNSSVGYAYLGFVYNETGLYHPAIEAFSHVKDYPFGNNLYSAYQGLAYAYGNVGMLDKSLEYYQKAADLKEDASVIYNIGMVYSRKGEQEKAAGHFERALKLNKNLLSAYPSLISIYKRLGKQEKLKKVIKNYETAKSYGQGESHFQNGVKAYMEGQFETAIGEFKESILANPANPAVYSNLGYSYNDIGHIDKAYEYQKKAIDLDPDFANAHYGLAMIYKSRNDWAGARKHWEAYLRIEPKGYFSRKAKEQITGLPGH